MDIQYGVIVFFVQCGCKVREEGERAGEMGRRERENTISFRKKNSDSNITMAISPVRHFCGMVKLLDITY